MILGLDSATKTGWCLMHEDGRVVESGVQDFSKKRGESNGLMFLRFRKWLSSLFEEAPINLVGYERAHFRGGAATEICVGLQTRVQEICAENEVESAPVSTSTLKKFATGSGRADKWGMILVAKRILGRDPVDDNEADAVLVADWARSEYAK
jgi:Holliday junction resolvasome RuvABC endonuclease subunit